MMNNLQTLRAQLQSLITVPQEKNAMFFKTEVGSYAEHDTFIGVNVPALRTLAKEFQHLTRQELQELLASPINEERLLALFILVDQYQKGNTQQKDALYNFYLHNIQYVNNWNLVDASAHLIIGEHLDKADKKLLITLAQSKNLWERRIAIVATWYFIRKNELEWTFKIAKLLLTDTHDLIHKAVGWMLREAGKRNETMLMQFLDKYAAVMPRTMLRYAIEKFPEEQRKDYLMRKKATP
jgi:3-methyladenine DNA glycosylase AlkD